MSLLNEIEVIEGSGIASICPAFPSDTEPTQRPIIVHINTVDGSAEGSKLK